MKIRMRWLAGVLGLTVVVAAVPARADVTAEALLKVLVRKGVLTADEAAAVRAEAEKESAAPRPPVPAAPATATSPVPVTATPKTSLSGYIQFRATSQKHARPSTHFMDRRARLTVRNATGTGRAVITLEAAPSAVALYDGYYDLFLGKAAPGVPASTLRMGQFMKPFGLEFERSTADYEFPELPTGWTALFPGYRDVGGVLSHAFDAANRADFGVVNGNGAGSITFTNRDNDNAKDIVARVRSTVPRVGEFALSGYKGKATNAGTGGAPSITGDRDRLGLGATLRSLAGGELRAEYVAARDLTANLGAGERVATAQARAWYAMFIRPASPRVQVGLRYDEWDPDTHNEYRLGGDGEVRTFGIVGVDTINETLKLMLAWERPRVTRFDTASGTSSTQDNDLLTFQGQYRF